MLSCLHHQKRFGWLAPARWAWSAVSISGLLSPTLSSSGGAGERTSTVFPVPPPIYQSTNPPIQDSTTPPLHQPTFRVKHWTTEDGLPEDRIGCIKQTRDGYLWIGTWTGLARFDGLRFTVFNKFNTRELTNAVI